MLCLALDSISEGSIARHVTADIVSSTDDPFQPGKNHFANEASPVGQSVIRISLTDVITRNGIPGKDYVDQPTFLLLPHTFERGTISVSICSGLRPDAPDYARGFAGIAFGIQNKSQDPSKNNNSDWTFESVYIRPTNGINVAPSDGPRRGRAVQYYTYPDWPFDKLRETYTEGTFEAGADIRPGQWVTLKVEVGDGKRKVWVDGNEVLVCDQLREVEQGEVGLWVDIGTVALFRDLSIQGN